MKILHVVPTYLPAVRYGGPIYSVHGLCRALVALGHEVHVFTTSVDGDSDSKVIPGQSVDLDGVQVWYFSSKHFRRLYYSPPMMHLLKECIADFELVHLHSVFLWPTWAAARMARQAGIPYVLSPRGMLVQDLVRRKNCLLKSCWIQLIEKRNLEKAAVIHVTSKKEAEELARFSFRLPKIARIPNGVDTPESWSSDELSDDVRAIIQKGSYVLFFGRLNWKKGIDRLLMAWKDIPDTQLIIAGNDEDGYLPELQNIAQSAGVREQVVFLARSIGGSDKEALFASARLFVLLSYSENFGITVLEAMIRGIPVVVTEEVGAAEIVRESGAGKVIKDSDLGWEIRTMLHDRQELAVMSREGLSHASELYSWEHIGAKMERVYSEVFDA